MLTKQVFLILFEGLRNSLVPTIAGVGGLIAYRQWRTAREKLVLDLFDKRYEVYQHICDACTRFSQSGAMDEAAVRSLAKGVSQAKFLFGKDVEIELDSFWKDAQWMRNFDKRYDVSQSEAQERMDERRNALFAKANSLLEGTIFVPYMKLDARL